MKLPSIPKFLRFGYDAAKTTNRRRSRPRDLKSEDNSLLRQEREKVISDTRDLRRNYTVAAWAIRLHLDYVSTFHFQCRTGIEAIDSRIEELMEWWQRPLNFDVAGRHSMQSMTRLTEAGATVDGDCFIMKVGDGRVQLIEGDRVRSPNDIGDYTGIKVDDFVHGVEVTKSGKALRYAICERTGSLGSFKLLSVVPEKYVFAHGYYDRYDQIRGVSPLTAAINQFSDLYEAQEYALAKMKLSQLFGLKVTRKEGGADEADEENPTHSFDFGGGPQFMDLAPGEDADFLQDKNPSSEFQQFMITGIQMGLKALDIPYSFYAENFSNYSGHRGALVNYAVSLQAKRRRVKELLHGLTVWRLQLWIADGELQLPEGMRISDIKFEWVPIAIPWIDPKKEAEANILRLENNLACHEDICREDGVDWYELMAKKAREVAYLEKLGLPVPAPRTQQLQQQQQQNNEEDVTDGNRN